MKNNISAEALRAAIAVAHIFHPTIRRCISDSDLAEDEITIEAARAIDSTFQTHAPIDDPTDKEKVEQLLDLLESLHRRLRGIFEHPAANQLHGFDKIATRAHHAGSDIREALRKHGRSKVVEA